MKKKIQEIQERILKLEREISILCSLLDVDVSYQYESLYGKDGGVE